MGELIYVGTLGNIEVRSDEKDHSVHLKSWAGIPGAPIAKPYWTCSLSPAQADVLIGLLQAARHGVERPHHVSHLLEEFGRGKGGTQFFKDPHRDEDETEES